MRSIISSTIALAVVPLVYGHGIITDPPPRQAGDAMGKVCGQQLFNQQKSDNGGNIQGELQVAASQKDYDPAQCNVFLCKGYQFQDNTANVQSFTAGQQVPIKVAIKAPHTGTCNVSVVDTKANAVIGQPLISFSDYASNSHTIPPNNTAFTVTMPDVGAQCGQAGNCVIQWFWDAPDIKQTYESCIDFTMGGGGAAPAAPAVKVAVPAAKPAYARAADIVRRQTISMETMTNGPSMTMTFSPVPIPSSATSATGEGGKSNSAASGTKSAKSIDTMSMTM